MILKYNPSEIHDVPFTGGDSLSDPTSRPHQTRNRRSNTPPPRLIPLLVIIAALLLAGCGGPSSRGSQSSGGEQAVQSSSEDQTSGGGGKLGTPALGDEGAPVVMIEYADYQ